MFRALCILTAASLTLSACGTDEDDDHGPDDFDIEAQAAASQLAGDGKADTTGCSGVRVPDQGDFGGRIALTFDDGPSAITTPTVLATLRAHHAPAAFFMLGKQVKANPDIVKEILLDDSFIVGSHTWSHPNMAQQSAGTVARQMDDTGAAFAEVGHTVKYFRFPYGSSTCATADAARARDYVITGWHVDSADWCYQGGNGYCSPSTFRYVDDAFRHDMTGYVLSQVKRSNGGIVLFHDIRSYTARELDSILTRLEQAGYTFTGLDDLDAFPELNGSAPAPKPFVGDGCEADADCDFSNAGRDGFCLGGFCSIPCAGFCPDKAGKAPTFCIADPDPEIAGGVCVSKAVSLNGDCADVPGSIDDDRDRFVGASNAAPANARVCAPKGAEE